MRRPSKELFSALALLPLIACGDDGAEDAEKHEDPAEHACEHTGETGETVRAGDEPDESAPEIEIGEPVTVQLREDSPSYLRVTVDEETSVLLFASAEHVVTGLQFEDAAEALEGEGANEFCEDDIPEHFDLDLSEAGTYYLRFGPAALDDVWILLTEAEGHAH